MRLLSLRRRPDPRLVHLRLDIIQRRVPRRRPLRRGGSSSVARPPAPSDAAAAPQSDPPVPPTPPSTDSTPRQSQARSPAAPPPEPPPQPPAPHPPSRAPASPDRRPASVSHSPPRPAATAPTTPPPPARAAPGPVFHRVDHRPVRPNQPYHVPVVIQPVADSPVEHPHIPLSTAQRAGREHTAPGVERAPQPASRSLVANPPSAEIDRRVALVEQLHPFRLSPPMAAA